MQDALNPSEQTQSMEMSYHTPTYDLQLASISVADNLFWRVSD